MANYWKDNEDLRWQFSQIDWDRLVDITEKSFPDEEGYESTEDAVQFFEDLLEQMGTYIADEIAPHWEELDEQHPELDENGEGIEPERMGKIMKGLAQLGAFGISHPRRLGGMNCPLMVTSIMMEMMARADVSVMSHFGFHGGIGQALNLYSLEEGSVEVKDGAPVKGRFDEQVRKMASGEEWGAMVLTEPGAGSDLGRIRSRAVLQDDGSWRLTGQKIWITSGHGEHHVVIARSEDPATHDGLKGLSLFYVPAHIEKDGKRVRNFEIGNFESKMGQHSAAACTINYDESYAELIGTRGHGFRGMLLLMNNARIIVGFEALGLMENAYRRALAFAEERVTMGKPIAQHEMIADYLDEMDVLIKGLRSITVRAAYYEEMASRLKSLMKIQPPADEKERREREKEIKRWQWKARKLTPLIKYVGGEEAVHFARMSMQIHGGMGYIKETGIEKLMRDALVIPVYEGTSQIQSLMALKDTMQGVLRNPGRFFSEMASTRLESMSARDPMERLSARMDSHAQSAIQTIITNIAADKLGDLRGAPVLEWKNRFMKNWDPNKDFSFGLMHAERLTKILCWNAMAQHLVEDARRAEGTDFAEERRDIAERFLERFEPRTRGVLLEIEEKGSLLKRIMRRRKNGAAVGEKGEEKAA